MPGYAVTVKSNQRNLSEATEIYKKRMENQEGATEAEKATYDPKCKKWLCKWSHFKCC